MFCFQKCQTPAVCEGKLYCRRCPASRSVRHLQSVKASSTVGGVLLEALRSQKEHMRMCTRTALKSFLCVRFPYWQYFMKMNSWSPLAWNNLHLSLWKQQPISGCLRMQPQDICFSETVDLPECCFCAVFLLRSVSVWVGFVNCVLCPHVCMFRPRMVFSSVYGQEFALDRYFKIIVIIIWLE